MRRLSFLLAIAVLFGGGCARKTDAGEMLNQLAERYVKLALVLGQHDENYVDAYYGPPAWKSQAAQQKVPLNRVRVDVAELQREIAALDVSAAPEMLRQRRRFLEKQVQAMSARAGELSGTKLTFDEETRLLYDAVQPPASAGHYDAVLSEIDRLLPGTGPLSERLEAERKRFAVPKDKLLAVFGAAIDEARKRTRSHIALPPDESFTVELVSGKPWSAYNWYQGNAHSRIEVNTDLPVDIDFAIHLACHEGYPGHHVYNTLLETKLRNERGWIEFSVYPLFSPESLVAEGSAEYGVDVVLPPAERLQFTKTVLYPLAGLDPARAESHLRVSALTENLREGETEAARDYLDGRKSREDAIVWMMKYSLLSRDRAEKRMSFIDTYRGYLINYGYGRQLVAAYMQRKGAAVAGSEAQWKAFETLLSTPVVPSELAGTAPDAH